MAKETLSAGRTMTDEELEKKLQPYVSKIKTLRALTIAGGVLALLGALMAIFGGMSTVDILLLLAGFAGVFAGIANVGKAKAEYDAVFRQEMGSELEGIIASYIGPNLENDLAAAKTRLEDAIRESGICGSFDTCRADSYRKGSRDGLSFEAFNASLTETVQVKQTDNDGGQVKSDRTYRKFDGCWLFAATKKDIPSPIVISELKDFEDPDHPEIGKREAGFWNLSTGDAAFDGRFKVHAGDEALARSLLTPAFLSWLTDLADGAGAKCGFCLRGKALYMAMSGAAFLDMEGASAGHIEDMRKNLKSSLEHTCGIMDRLMRNKDLF